MDVTSLQPQEKAVLRMLVERAEKQLNAELFAGLIRVQSDPAGVRAEAMAVRKSASRLLTELT